MVAVTTRGGEGNFPFEVADRASSHAAVKTKSKSGFLRVRSHFKFIVP
jgi:hypothetical protein